MPYWHGAGSGARALRLGVEVRAQVRREIYRTGVAMLTIFARRADLARIGVPVLVVAGSDDVIAPPAMMERMAQKIPGAEYVQLPGCGHPRPLDQPEALNSAVLAFLPTPPL